ncbi:MAG: ABC transporter permease [Acidobacteria bacterium]|nr:MAG: ABC transporter permease [Acidobacteriota bacterium]
MARINKIGVVTRFELESTVKRPGYLIATFGMPLFLLLYAGLVSIPAYFMTKKESEPQVFGIVDRAAVLGLEGSVQAAAIEVPPEVAAVLEATGQQQVLAQALGGDAGSVFRPYADEAAARRALAGGEIAAYYLLAEDYLATGRADVYFAADASWDTKGARGALERLLVEGLLADRLPPELAARVKRPIAASKSFTVAADGTVQPRDKLSRILGVAVPLGFTILLFISTMISAGYLIQGTAVEKENKVVEVLLAAADPDEILLGKLLGLGGAGLLQITVWLSMVLAAGIFFAGTLAALGVELPWFAFMLAPPFFVAAYFFIGSLILGTGSLGKNLKEIQQFSMIWSLLPALPMFFLGVLMTEPNGVLGKVLTWIPFSTPMAVVLRMTLEPEGIAWWEIGGSFLLMLAATWFAIRLGARLFRVGLLLGGARPRWREVLRQARLSA